MHHVKSQKASAGKGGAFKAWRGLALPGRGPGCLRLGKTGNPSNDLHAVRSECAAHFKRQLESIAPHVLGKVPAPDLNTILE